MGYTPPWFEVRKVAGGYAFFPPTTTTTDDVSIYPNGTDSYSRIVLLGNSGMQLYVKAGAALSLYADATLAGRFYYDSGNNQYIVESSIADKDLYLSTAGTGVVKFGTYTADATVSQAGYITVKDNAGNTRYLSCITP